MSRVYLYVRNDWEKAHWIIWQTCLLPRRNWHVELTLRKYAEKLDLVSRFFGKEKRPLRLSGPFVCVGGVLA